MGFQFGEYFLTLVFISLGAILGSYIGSKARNRFNNQMYLTLMKYLLSLLTLARIIYQLLPSNFNTLRCRD